MGGQATKTNKFPVLPALAFLGIVISILAYQINLHPQNGLVDHDANHTAAEWHAILDGKTLLLIGGPHRGGTTLLRKALHAHPAISSLGREGILIQDVYSRYGCGVREHIPKKMEGIGRYALGKEDVVHLTEEDDRVNPENMARLLNRFDYYWNTSKSILVEKSPPTAVMSRFLQAIYNEGRPTNIKGLNTKFLFVTRHPVANVFAHQSALKDVLNNFSFDTLMKNFIQVHKYLNTDMQHLKNEPMLITLEEFAANPNENLEKLYKWLGVDSSEETIDNIIQNRMPEGIVSDPNAKYRERWCSGALEQRNIVAETYQDAINEVGLKYDLKSWCGDEKK